VNARAAVIAATSLASALPAAGCLLDYRFVETVGADGEVATTWDGSSSLGDGQVSADGSGGADGGDATSGSTGSSDESGNDSSDDEGESGQGESGDDTGGTTTGMPGFPASTCTGFCATAVVCDAESYPSQDDCLMACLDLLLEGTQECQSAHGLLNVCLGELVCDAFLEATGSPGPSAPCFSYTEVVQDLC
jgi:hypothetical protein